MCCFHASVEDMSSVSEVSEHDSDEEDTEASTNTCFDCCTTSKLDVNFFYLNPCFCSVTFGRGFTV